MTDIAIILQDIGTEIEHLIGQGLDRTEAELRAVASVWAKAAYEQNATPHEVRLMSVVQRISSQTRQPAPTNSICAEIGADYFATYYHLRNLERRGLIQRPKGQRSGWQVA